ILTWYAPTAMALLMLTIIVAGVTIRGGDEFTTVTGKAPKFDMADGGTVAVSWVSLTGVVARFSEPMRTFDVELKFWPFTVKVNGLPLKEVMFRDNPDGEAERELVTGACANTLCAATRMRTVEISEYRGIRPPILRGSTPVMRTE